VSALLVIMAAQCPAQVLADFAEVQAGCALPGDYGIIRGAKQTLVLPVEFPDQPLEAVSGYCVADFAAHGYPYSYGAKGRFRPEDDEMGGVNLLPQPGNPQKVRSFQEPFIPG
jgi:hypothetical protein